MTEPPSVRCFWLHGPAFVSVAVVVVVACCMLLLLFFSFVSLSLQFSYQLLLQWINQRQFTKTLKQSFVLFVHMQSCLWNYRTEPKISVIWQNINMIKQDNPNIKYTELKDQSMLDFHGLLGLIGMEEINVSFKQL